MKINPKAVNFDGCIAYLIDCKDGQFTKGYMKVEIAEELMRSCDINESGVEGFELRLDSNVLFPKDSFVFDEGELEARLPKPKQSKKLAGNKSEQKGE